MAIRGYQAENTLIDAGMSTARWQGYSAEIILKHINIATYGCSLQG